jgi:hypothetical protein
MMPPLVGRGVMNVCCGGDGLVMNASDVFFRRPIADDYLDREMKRAQR